MKVTGHCLILQLTEGDVQSVLAEVDPDEPAGAGGRPHGDHGVVIVLHVRHHRHLVLAAGEVVAHTDWRYICQTERVML